MSKLDDIRIEKIISTPIWATFIIIIIIIIIYLFIFEVAASIDFRHCPKLQSCTISRKTNDATWMEKMAKTLISDIIWATQIFFHRFYLY